MLLLAVELFFFFFFQNRGILSKDEEVGMVCKPRYCRKGVLLL